MRSRVFFVHLTAAVCLRAAAVMDRAPSLTAAGFTSADHHVRRFLLHQARLPIQNKNSWMCQLKLPFSLLLSSQRCLLPQRETWFIHLFTFQGNTWSQSERIFKKNIKLQRQKDSIWFLLIYYSPLFHLLDQTVVLLSLSRLIRLLIKLLTVWSNVLFWFLAPFSFKSLALLRESENNSNSMYTPAASLISVCTYSCRPSERHQSGVVNMINGECCGKTWVGNFSHHPDS